MLHYENYLLCLISFSLPSKPLNYANFNRGEKKT